jgi:drug/metabolite transporter (DMT)-like permease
MKIGLSYVGPLDFVFQRLVLSTCILSLFLVFLWKKVPKDKSDVINLLILGAINTASMLLTHIGLINEKSGIGAILTYTQPLFVFCIAVPFLKEKATISRVAGVLIGFLGVVLLSIKEGSIVGSLTPSIFFLIFGAFLWAVNTVYYKKYLSHVNPIVTNIFQLGIGAALLAPPSIIIGGLSFSFSSSYLFALLYLSIFAVSLAWTIWIFLLREEEATVLSSSSLVIPIIAFFFGWLVLGESIELKSLFGAVLVMIGVYLVNKTS